MGRLRVIKTSINKIIATYGNSYIVADECALMNLNRIFFLLIIMIPSRALNILSLKDIAIESLAWSHGIITIHTWTIITWCLILPIVIYLRKRNQVNLAVSILQYFVPGALLVSGIVVTAIDQLITTNITPFLMACIATGIVFLIKPSASIPMYIASYIVYYNAIAINIIDEQILLTNRINGLTSVLIGALISVLFWYYNYTNTMQKRRIKRQQKQLEQMAYYDSLTNVYNRHYFNKIIRQGLWFNQRSVIMFLDLDNFKNINDNYGHLVGDQVLKQFAELLTENIRQNDIIIRFGGEEFIILVPGISLEEGIEFAERLKRLISDSGFIIEGQSINITSSFGVVLLQSSGDDEFENSLEKADKALYKAKKNGKNRVEFIE